MKLAVLVSGTGTNLAAMIRQHLPIELVVADKDCPALELAAEAGIHTVLVDRTAFGYHAGAGDNWDRSGFSAAVAAALCKHDIDVAAMAGFFTILDPVFFVLFLGWLLNLHPALLPAFPGDHAVRDTIASGATETGTTIHIATEVLDDATYIVRQQGGIPIAPDDTEADVHARIKVLENQLYPQVLGQILSGDISLNVIKERT